MITKTTIGIRSARFHAFHGYYPEEQLYGHTFIVDCEVQLSDEPGNKDDLAKTLNYESLYHAIQQEMNTKQRLLETVIQRIISRIESFAPVKGGYVQIIKEGAQLGGPLQGTVVRMDFAV